MHELPLVFFTVIAQSVIGLMLFSRASSIVKGSININYLKIAQVSAVLMVVALVCSFFHLGQPLRSFNVIAGIGRSPMSNEIFLCGTFTGLLVVTLVAKKLGYERLFHWGSWLAALTGVLFAWSITRVYHLETVATWSSNYGLLSMLVTILLCGGTLSFNFNVQKLGLSAVFVGIILNIVMLPWLVTTLLSANSELTQAQMGLWSWQAALHMITFACLMWSAYKNKKSWANIGLILIFLSEILSRIAFYNLWYVM